jgi:gamma-glutamyltranspeptidase/glutathione hydrolase
MSQRFGVLPWAELFEAAIRAADEGFAVDERTASFIDRAFPDFPEHARAFYGKNGSPLSAGDVLVQKDLAESLRLLAEQGAAAIYGGPLGEAIDSAMRQSGGFLALEDLAGDRAEWWTPISLDYRGYRVVTPSAPAGAFPMLVRLGMIFRRSRREGASLREVAVRGLLEGTDRAYRSRPRPGFRCIGHRPGERR